MKARDGTAADQADLIVCNAKITTLQSNGSVGEARAVRGEKFVAVGGQTEVMRLVGDGTRVVDADGMRVIPGLNDSHMHAIRGGLPYNLELRWDGVGSLQRGLEMIRDQARRTPQGQWVRVMGGWSPYQFTEKRMPAVAELTGAAPQVPVLVLFAYSQALLNRAGAAALGLSPGSEPAGSGRYEFTDGGLAVWGNTAVYATIGGLPGPPDPGDRLSSTQYFFRELNRFGLTSTVDAGESATAYPEDYQAVATLAAQPGFPVRISNFLFAQKPGTELAFWEKLTAQEHRGRNRALSRLDGYVLRGAGEVLAWSAHDYENFLHSCHLRPDDLPGTSRVRAGLRRDRLFSPVGDRPCRDDHGGEHRADQGLDEPVVVTEHFTIDLAVQQVTRDGRAVPLTRTEWRIIALLARHPGGVITQKQLLADIWGLKDTRGNNYMRVFLVTIRRKLEPDPAHPRYFITEPGIGVRFLPGARPGPSPALALDASA